MKNKLSQGAVFALVAVMVGLLGTVIFRVFAFNGPSSGAGVGGGAISVNASGSVGIGIASPGFKLDVQGGQINSSGGYCMNGSNCIAAWPSGGSSQWTTGGGGIYYNGLVGIATTSATYELDVGSGGATTARFGTAAADTVVVGGGAGKITAGTFDPLYKIDGQNYATYLPGMTGNKEETAGTVTLTLNSNGSAEATLDFASAAKGSDLWLFRSIIDASGNFDQVMVSLTPSFDGRVWYEKDRANDRIVIHGTTAGEVSYQLIGKRFDWQSFPNMRPAGDGTGLVPSDK